ncbi:hypothetical protein C8J56DRAFT_1061585 [Mycena floridula]|nr:hypothetical protein C8J56DRAFT_1061585 [Mycena floridula]
MYQAVYHQLGGYRSTLMTATETKFPTSDLAAKDLAAKLARPDCPLVAGNGTIDLIFGIRNSGASCLLLTQDQVDQVNKARLGYEIRCKSRAHEATQFASLSPAQLTIEQVKKLLAGYQVAWIKTGQKNKRAYPSRDNSKINKIFYSEDSEEPTEITSIAFNRALFEQARLLYFLMKPDEGSSISVALYNISDSLVCAGIRLCSFSMNCWSMDKRSVEERERDPFVHLLDVGFSKADVGKWTPVTSEHLIQAENIYQSQGHLEKASFQYGQTETMKRQSIEHAIREFFRASHEPMVLLVHGEEKVRNLISRAGIDTGTWKSLGELFSPSNKGFNRSPGPSAQRQRSSRSASPVGNKSTSGRPRSPRPTATNVYVIDVGKMFTARTTIESSTVGYMSDFLGISKQETKVWCAGNDAVRLFQIFCNMAEGENVDLQKGLGPQSTPIILSEPSLRPTLGENDDPNDFVPTSTATKMNSDDEISDYGGSGSDE